MLVFRYSLSKVSDLSVSSAEYPILAQLPDQDLQLACVSLAERGDCERHRVTSDKAPKFICIVGHGDRGVIFIVTKSHCLGALACRTPDSSC
jgi:hypothetical protein